MVKKTNKQKQILCQISGKSAKIFLGQETCGDEN